MKISQGYLGFLGRRNSVCKGPEIALCPASSENSRDASVAGVESSRGQEVSSRTRGHSGNRRESKDGVGVEGPILRVFVGLCMDFGSTPGEMGREWRVLSREVIGSDLNFKWIYFAAVLRVDGRGWERVEQGEGERDREKVIVAGTRVTGADIVFSG